MLLDQHSGFDRDWLTALARRYGTRVSGILGDAQRLEDLGQHFGAGLTEAEARYLHQHEWAWQADDILWRRSKCGLHMSDTERQQFREWFARELG